MVAGVTFTNTLNCSCPTIDAGIEDLKRDKLFDYSLVRKSGGEKKCLFEGIAGIDDIFKVLNDFTADKPIDQKMKWTHINLNN